METLPYVILAVGVSFLAIVAAIRFILLHHEARNKVTFLILLGSVIWLLMSALEVASNSLPTKLVFFKMHYVGLLIVPTTWLINAMQLSGYDRWVKRSNLVALSVVPVITLLLIFTNPQGLMWSNFTLNSVDPFFPLNENAGLGYWPLIVGYSYVVLMFAVVIFVRRVVASRSLYRREAFPLIFVSCVPWAFSAVWLLNPSIFMYIDPTPLPLTVATSIILWRLAYLPGADVVPVAHEMIVDSMNEAVIILDAQTRIAELNPRAQQLLGHNLSDALGKPVERMWAEWAGVKKELDYGTEGVREVSFGVGEEKKVYEMQSSHLSGIASERPNLLIIFRDITERKRIENALQESERRLRLVTDHMLDMIIQADLRGVFEYVSPSHQMLGYEPKDLLGKSIFELIHPDDLERSVNAFLEGFQDRSPKKVEIRFKHADGHYVWIETVGNPIFDEEDEVSGAIIGSRDITERKMMDDKLRLYSDHLEDLVEQRTKELREAQRMATIGQTAAMVGHDLRNPLQAMTNTLYLVKRLMAFEKAEDRKEAQGLVSVLKDQIQYMDKIVSDLQDYARPVGAKLVETSLDDLVREAVSGLEIPGNVEVAVNVGVGLSNVKLDPVLFRRVLTNLILNAVQAMPNGGKLTITSSSGDESFAVGVQDTGVGIAPENLGRVFTPFFTTKAKGQGLGLAVCKRLMEAQGGTITVTSQAGKGSTFTLKIPTNRPLGAT